MQIARKKTQKVSQSQPKKLIQPSIYFYHHQKIDNICPQLITCSALQTYEGSFHVTCINSSPHVHRFFISFSPRISQFRIFFIFLFCLFHIYLESKSSTLIRVYSTKSMKENINFLHVASVFESVNHFALT